jgi:hemolysin activation/secretion protein
VTGGGILRPGTALGASELVFALLEPRKASFSFNVNNSGSNLLGPWGFAASALLTNPFPYPGQLSLGVVGSPDLQKLRSFNARYAAGLGSNGVVASVGVIASQSKPRGLGIESQSSTVAPRARMPLQRARATSVYLEGGLTINQSHTSLEGTGTRITEDKATVADVALILVDTVRGNGATQVTVGLSFGTDWFGALDSADPRSGRQDFDQKFTKLTYGLQRNQNLPGRLSATVVLRGQHSNDRLVSGEQISFGGGQIGRGYDGGTIAGDRGLGGLVELRWDMPPLERLSLGPGGRLQWFTAADWARVQRIGEASESLRSVSAGARYRNDLGWSVEGTVAYGQVEDQASDPRSNPRYLISTTRAF